MSVGLGGIEGEVAGIGVGVGDEVMDDNDEVDELIGRGFVGGSGRCEFRLSRSRARFSSMALSSLESNDKSEGKFKHRVHETSNKHIANTLQQ